MSDHIRFTEGAGRIGGRTSLLWVTGTDAVPFLDGLLSQNVAAIPPGRGARSLLLAPNGKLRAVLRILRGEDRIGLLCDAGVHETVVGDLNRFRIRVDVDIAVEDGRVLDVWGYGAAAAVGYDGSGWEDRADVIIAAYPLQRSNLPRFITVGLEPDTPTIPADLLDSIRISAGEPVVGVDLDEKVIPQEAMDVSSAVDFAKGCYLGQELVARIDSRGHVNRRLAGLLFPSSDTLATGSEVTHEHQPVGRLTSVARLEDVDGSIALGMLRAEVEEGAGIVAGGVTGRVTSLPMSW